MKKKRILILGSAPNSVVPCADVVYCANASVHYHAQNIINIPNIVSVVGSQLVAATSQSSASIKLKQIRNLVFTSKMHKMIVLEHEPWFDGWDIYKGLRDVEDYVGVKPRLLTFNERRILLKKTSGIQEPIYSRTLFTEAAVMSPKRFLRTCKCISKEIFRKTHKTTIETNPVLRPSTGIWAALLAIEKYGPHAKYIVSGITLDSLSIRSIQHNGISPIYFKTFTHHLHADIRVFNTLRKAYDVEYT